MTEAPLWNVEADDTLVCRGVIDETHDVRTFLFGAATPRRFAYEPGQFANIEVEVGGTVETRSYTLSSAPTRPDLVAITVKRIPGGVVSNHLHETLEVGAKLKVQLPLGDFTHARRAPRKILFLAAGVGVTPLMSMLRTIVDRHEPVDVVFATWNQAAADIVFAEELAHAARRHPSLSLAHVLTRPTGRDAWAGHRGRIDATQLKAIAPDLAGREVYCCGPDGFMAAAKAALASLGHDPARYFEESFVFGSGEAAEAAPVDPGAQVYKVTFAKTGKVIECDGSTSILAAAKKGGIALPSACTKGLCGTCKQKKLAGDVEMSHSGGIRQREIDAGMILLCCSKPRSDVTVDK
ncbi:FAD-binding oxidoreductase [Methyloraptor flagellatus]|uniref:FAD-binding oxidoreductase n=1 Tax=Methyloraptor flagellatus TaxID=3162530 RepID=A0AAU7XEF8_9HYPH